MKAEEIYDMINNNLVTRSSGVNLIKNYGLRRERYAVKALLKDTPLEMEMKMSETINRMSVKLDEMLEKIVEGCKKK